MANDTTHRSGGVKSTETALEIITTIQSMEPVSLAELSRTLDFAKSTIHNHLQTLERNEYVVRSDGRYRLSLKFFSHGMHTREQRDISRVGQPIIDELAETTGEGAWIVVEEHGWAIFLNRALGERAIPTHASLGKWSSMYHLASGKAILAHLPEERVERIVERSGLDRLTANTVTDRGELFEELDRVREEGFAYNEEETVDGLRAIAAPVLDGEAVHGSIPIAGPANRLTIDRCEEEIKPLLRKATNEIELQLQFE